MNATATLQNRAVEPREARPTTLLELVTTLSEVTDNERELVATVLYMLQAGHVRLCGNFRDTPVEDLARQAAS